MNLIDYYKKLILVLKNLLNETNEINIVIAKDNTILFNDNNVEIDYMPVNAKYFPIENVLYVNLDKHNLKIHDELFSIIHEYRHFYQYNKIQNLDVMNNSRYTDKLIKWKNNFDNYKKYGNNEYYMQDVEIDANAFTIYLVEILFHRKCYINNKFSKTIVEDYQNIYKDLYPISNIEKIIKEYDFKPDDLFQTYITKY